LYAANVVRIIPLLFASGMSFFLTIWWHTGITHNPRKIAAFVLGCIVSGFLLINGFGILVAESSADAS
jgi:uncharacterized membrane protein YjjP (DUF1212 family)